MKDDPTRSDTRDDRTKKSDFDARVIVGSFRQRLVYEYKSSLLTIFVSFSFPYIFESVTPF